MPAKQARSIVFTHNNYAEGDLLKLQEWDAVEYGCVGKEVGESGTPHLQGYLKFKKRTSLKKLSAGLKEILGVGCYTDVCKGGPKKAIEYCKKDGDAVEWGECPKQGKRTDLHEAAAMIKEGKRMIEVAEHVPCTYVRYHRGLEKLQQLYIKESAEAWREVEVIFITGPTGCGKTRQAMEDGPERKFKIQGDQLKWFDGYEGEKTLVIDEYANDVKITQLLSLLDGYKLRLPVKGGFTYAGWTKVYITSNLHELHEQAKEAHREALQRRISKTINYWPHKGVSAMAETYAEERMHTMMDIDDKYLAMDLDF